MHLTPRQLATRWQVSEKTLERWRQHRIGPAFLKIVGRVLYPIAGVQEVEASGVPPTKAQRDTPASHEGAA